MKFGVREICNVVFKAKAKTTIGATTFEKGQPVLYIDTAKTSTIEGAATTVYAQGGRGNSRLVTWEGEKTLTFSVEDALLSPIGFSMLSGAGLFKKPVGEQLVHVHTTSKAIVSADGEIDLTDALGTDETIDKNAPVCVMITEADGSLSGEIITGLDVDADGKIITGAEENAGDSVFVDFYIAKDSARVNELQIDAENFAGAYYVEADTLFRDQNTGKDLPANITLPNVKIQSNFTFSMASTGDPSTFTFTMDAMPGYTMFDQKKKVLCVIQILDDVYDAQSNLDTVMGHPTGFDLDENEHDSVITGGEASI